jgi:cytidylate kinase
MPVITIRGQMGSGAPEIGKMVAERLHTDYVDREIISQVAARLSYPEEKIEKQEMPPATLIDRIVDALEHTYPAVGGGGMGVPLPASLPAWQIPLDSPIYLAGLESVIKELAKSNSIVIRGRGSQFILKNIPGALHVLVVAPLKIRLTRVMSSGTLDEKTARQEVARFDNSRKEFIKRYFKEDLENPVNYDVVINTEHLTFGEAVSIILDTISLKNPIGGRPRLNSSA